MNISRRFTLLMAVIALVLYASNSAFSDELPIPDSPPQNQEIPVEPGLQQFDEEWTMEIQPAIKSPTTVPAPTAVPAVSNGAEHVITFDRAEYARIYNSIPFNRAEYDVNPGYRHDATMEILTGNARHQTIVRHNHVHKQPVKPVPAASRPSRLFIPFNLPGVPFGSSYGFGFGFNALSY